jgi:N-acetylmuramoyl-L-alanine amidase
MLLATLPAATASLAAELVIDNSDGSVQVKGPWTSTTTTRGFYGANYLFRTPGDGSSSVTWPFPSSAAAGRYAVYAQWSGGPNRASNATYQVSSAAGSSSVSVNQKTNGGSWQPLGTFDFAPNKAQGVVLTDKADGVVVADAIRFVGPQNGAPPSSPTTSSAPPQTAAATPTTPAPQPAPSASPPANNTNSDPRTFSQTGYRIAEDAFWNYFQVRGGLRTFGYPVSNTFYLYGTKVQIFQRQIMQLRPDGGAQTMNILDDGLLPYTHMNGSTFPAPDPSVIAQSPSVDDPDYLAKAMDFVRATAPDTFDGQTVNFSKTFFSSVTAQDAYPNGVPPGGDALLPYFNLEIWGLPTSKPAHDPTNPDFIYQRFQRGIMHYDKSCGCTQGLLLADYVKALLTGQNLPADLAKEAGSSKLANQFKPNASQWLARPADLPGSDLTNAFAYTARTPIVTLDAGHGGSEIGTSHTFPDGTVLSEKDLNLRVMLRVRDLLQQANFKVVTTRTTDAQVDADKKDVTGDGKATLSDDLQARIDIANNAGSDIFVSIHFNGTSDTSTNGTYVFYDPDRPYTDRSKALADLVDASLVKFMKDAGYTPADHGSAKDTSVLAGDHYYLLSPKTTIVPRPSGMPAIIGEGLFLTNDADANALRNNAVVEAIAQGYAAGIKAYFGRYPVS